MRLDAALHKQGLTDSRSQAENYIKLGLVTVNKEIIKKASFQVKDSDELKVISQQYVSRAALKLASVNELFNIDFRSASVLDVGSSTGGFTDFALQQGADHVTAVDVGTDQLHMKLRQDERIELHEKMDIRDFKSTKKYDYIVADVSFISLTKILPSLKRFSGKNTRLIMMCTPQFAAQPHQVNKGIIKNSALRREILRSFEQWLNANKFIVLDKADSQVSGTKGNVERFYKLKTT